MASLFRLRFLEVRLLVRLWLLSQLLMLPASVMSSRSCGQNFLNSIRVQQQQDLDLHVKMMKNSRGRVESGVGAGAVAAHSGVDKLFQELDKIAILYKDPGMPSPCYRWNCTSPDHQWECRWCLPYAIIPGMPKSGTSEIFALLDLHPQVRGSRYKEINIFSEFEFISMTDFELKVSAYLSSPNMTPETNWWVDPTSIWIDGSAVCAYYTSCMNALSKYSPQTKSIVIVRDPYQRLASFLCMIHQDYLKRTHLLNRTSEQFINWLSEMSALATDNFTGDYDTSRTIYYILEMRSRWKDVLVLDNYDLSRNRTSTMLQVEAFLGIKPYDSYGTISGVNAFGQWGSELGQITSPREQFIYRYNSTTTIALQNLFHDFLCVYRQVQGVHLHIVTETGMYCTVCAVFPCCVDDIL
jgi:hypothetical protein